ncbi:MAG TPA: hypothetical protein VLK84_05400 [Longimicrobium sp.]|nr:hypothetical protein [Longimicrobium sp.]
MSDIFPGVFYFIILMVIVFAVSRVMARFTGNKFARALKPLVPVIGGTFSTDSLTSGWLTGAYRGRTVHATAIPGVAPQNEFSSGSADRSSRYNAFEVALQDVPGASDWSVTFGMHSMGQILSREETWRITADDPALEARLQASPVIDALQRFAGAGVRGYPTVRYAARQKSLTHRDSVFPGIAPPPEHFQKQLDLALRLAEINEQVNPAAPVPAAR